ncbi:MAG TPA: alginate lyase family protein, partial [Pirellulales bacterium]
MKTSYAARSATRVRICAALVAAVAVLLLVATVRKTVQGATGAKSSADTATESTSALPKVFHLRADRLQANRERFRAGDLAIVADVEQLEQEAKRLLDAKPLSVVEKDYTPPSGDKHDYMSQAPYFWADPTQADGAPYIRRDGERNPEINKYRNHQNMSRMAGNVEILALAYYFTGEEKYADKASEFLRVWFLDPATKMNPNLQFAQAIPGTNTGRGIGIIESICLARLVDDIGLLAGSKSWTDANQRGLEQWYNDYLKWMQESTNGHEESAAKNNHGTYYDMQVVSYAMFLGKMDVAKSVLEQVGEKRIAKQIETDGREPLELARTKAWSYSTGNLSGLMSLARLAEHADIDLWHYKTSDGRSIQQAVDFL